MKNSLKRIIKEKIASGMSKAKVARDFSITRATLYQYLNKVGQGLTIQ